jgi:hypothetical protein
VGRPECSAQIVDQIVWVLSAAGEANESGVGHSFSVSTAFTLDSPSPAHRFRKTIMLTTEGG